MNWLTHSFIHLTHLRSKRRKTDESRWSWSRSHQHLTLSWTMGKYDLFRGIIIIYPHKRRLTLLLLTRCHTLFYPKHNFSFCFHILLKSYTFIAFSIEFSVPPACPTKGPAEITFLLLIQYNGANKSPLVLVV